MTIRGAEPRQVDYTTLFHRGTGTKPFPFQEAFAHDLPLLVNVPTGLGKTAMAVLGWLWRRQWAGENVRGATPRRLIYCLPMRVLVEQTRDNAEAWITQLREQGLLTEIVPVHILIGGEDAGDWELHPERDMILIGTQDMLLSRSLNRGYAAARSRWPMQFGLLNTDCLWVFDEIQLMGSGLATTAQLEAFRRLLGAKDGNGCRSVWMSATLRPEWLRTVDFRDRIDDHGRIDGRPALSLTSEDHKNDQVKARWNAKKPLKPTSSAIDLTNQHALAEEIVKAHDESRGRTVVVANTVKLACDLLAAIKNQWPAGTDDSLILIHSRFRPPERAAQIKKLRAETPPEQLPPDGMIVVSTQVIEAGVDVSATTLFTELAPWASLVQRFGRCNRRGEQNEHASVRWIDLPPTDADAEKLRFPYELPDLRVAAEQLRTLTDVGLGSLAEHRKNLSKEQQEALFPHQHTHVIRRRDLIDLFDTTPDLAGNDIDIDRYVREIEETDVRVFWRAWDQPRGFEPPPDDKARRRPARDELCPAPVGEFKDFATKGKGKGAVWRWDFTEGRWQRVQDKNAIYPGQTYLVHASAGGYDPNRGWIGTKGSAEVTPIEPAESVRLNDDSYDDDGLSKSNRWQTIAEHTDDVCRELDEIVQELALEAGEQAVLRVAARWHDLGKAHEVFQAIVPEGALRADALWAKASGEWKRYRDVKRPHFRHELASALAVLQRPHDSLKSLSDDDLNLVAYLIAAHHGKVRLSIRSMPNETRPPTDNGLPRRFARGVWEGDALPHTNLGGSVVTPDATISLEPMEIGLCKEAPFVGQPSWQERAIRLLDRLGPFRLAYLEALLRAADWRASARASCGAGVPAPEEAAHV